MEKWLIATILATSFLLPGAAAVEVGAPEGLPVTGFPTALAADGIEAEGIAQDPAFPTALDFIPTVDGGKEYVVLVESLGGVRDGDLFHGARVLWTYASADGIFQFLVASVVEEGKFRASVLGDPNVILADLNRPVRSLLEPNDPFYKDGRDYGDKTIGANVAWDTTLGSTAVKVGITDTGINKGHDDTGYKTRSVAEKDCIDKKKDVSDGHGHGTHVTGIALGTTNNGIGIAGVSQSSIIVAQVLNSAGSGSDASVACGVDFVRTEGGHIVSMSLGASADLASTKTAIQNFWNGGNGGVPVAASGNDGCVGNGCVDFPARMVEVIAVGAVDKNKVRAGFSDGGPELDLVAPGVDIWSTWKACFGSPNCYARASGTSQATPHVAGTAALVKSNNAAFTAQQVRDRLITNAEDLGDAGRDDAYGNGLVRADLSI